MGKQILIVEDEFVVANDLSSILKRAGYSIVGIADSVKEALRYIEDREVDMVLLDIHLKGKLTGIDLAKKLRDLFVPFIYISANSNKSILDEAKTTRPYGFLVKPFREKDVVVALEIALFHHGHEMELQLKKEALLKAGLRTILNGDQSMESILMNLVKTLQAHVPFDFIELVFRDGESRPFFIRSFLRIGFEEYQSIGNTQLSVISGISEKELMGVHLDPPPENFSKVYTGAEFKSTVLAHKRKFMVVDTFKLRSQMAVPLVSENGTGKFLYFYSKQPEVYGNDHLELLERTKPDLNEVLKLLLGVHKGTIPLRGLEKMPKEAVKLQGYGKMIGRSPQLLKVFDHVRIVAPMETSVLIMGESGTGKELVAKSIHEASSRKERKMVTVNCGALPANLMESILFGHEKGAFTGAVDRKIGKFEQAHGSTLFLDEIGEMPMELQVKLLRALQEREIERLGGEHPIKTDVRIIAATNRDLETAVSLGNFRLDLYYRLHVFPLALPPLRERREDIPLLATHFLNKYSIQGKQAGVSDQVMEKIMQYSWPGNIRELENYMERSVLLSNNGYIDEVYPPLGVERVPSPKDKILEGDQKTLFEMERAYILSILRKCRGKVFGSGGAAEILKVPASTLNSKMKKLGIRKEDIRMLDMEK
ncbi:MAG: sigma 54-interacting response regulator [Sediminicola sp.]